MSCQLPSFSKPRDKFSSQHSSCSYSTKEPYCTSKGCPDNTSMSRRSARTPTPASTAHLQRPVYSPPNTRPVPRDPRPSSAFVQVLSPGTHACEAGRGLFRAATSCRGQLKHWPGFLRSGCRDRTAFADTTRRHGTCMSPCDSQWRL